MIHSGTREAVLLRTVVLSDIVVTVFVRAVVRRCRSVVRERVDGSGEKAYVARQLQEGKAVDVRSGNNRRRGGSGRCRAQCSGVDNGSGSSEMSCECRLGLVNERSEHVVECREHKRNTVGLHGSEAQRLCSALQTIFHRAILLQRPLLTASSGVDCAPSIVRIKAGLLSTTRVSTLRLQVRVIGRICRT